MENLPKIEINTETLSNLKSTKQLEWIITNGLGGYASSSILDINTRKYHGLLVAPFNPPADRRVIVSKLDEKLRIGGNIHPLGSTEFRNEICPEGYKNLIEFSRYPTPTFTYSVDGIKLRKTILMPHNRNITSVTYETLSQSDEIVILQIAPFVNNRHFHDINEKERTQNNFSQYAQNQSTQVLMKNPQSTLLMISNTGKFYKEEKWVEDILYSVDQSIGTSCFDDCFVPGWFEINLTRREKNKAQVILAIDNQTENTTFLTSTSKLLESSDQLFHDEYIRQQNLLEVFDYAETAPIQRDLLKLLVLASDSFIVHRSSTGNNTIIAGYHWFEDWGRDSLISLPGLTLLNGRFEDAREILLTFLHYCRHGIIPNHFPDKAGDAPVYNTVDATLWYINAVLQYLKYSGDFTFVKKRLWRTLQSVLEHHIQGTINKIGVDNDGLLNHGPQLTWMDAMINDRAVTPREGKAVEIQALWFNSLKTMELLATTFGQSLLSHEYSEMAVKAQSSFRRKFWNHQENCLFDVVKGEEKDASVRPNQILAASLDFSMLTDEERVAVVQVVQDRLWTKCGLRTLSADNHEYRGKYSGNWEERNFAYHNGTVWPWLIGPFITAFLKTKNFSEDWRLYSFKNFLKPLFEVQLFNAGVGTLSEVFDGDPPHTPGGCISQAWSVAEPLRAYIEDITLRRPTYEKRTLEENWRICEADKKEISPT